MPQQQAAFEDCLAAFCDEAGGRLNALGASAGAGRRSLAEAGLLDSLPQAFVGAATQFTVGHLARLEARMLPVPVKWVGLRDRPPTARAAMGLFILTAFAIVAREHASQGTLWPFVREHLPRRLMLDRTVLGEIFDGGVTPNPSRFVKDMIHEAVDHYPIRHVIGAQGRQHWYLTIHLQFGFSDKHFEESGDRWMAGVGLPQAVEMLLGQLHLDGEGLVSDRFRRYWNVLKAFHNGEVGQSRALAEVVSLGWLAKERATRLLDAASAFDQRRACRVDSGAVDVSVLRLGQPLLLRPAGTTPMWLYDLQIPDGYPLMRDEYQVHVGTRKVGSIQYASGGATAWSGAQLAVTSSASIPSVIARVPLELGPWREPALLTDGLAVTGGTFALNEQQTLEAETPLVLAQDKVEPTVWRIWEGSGQQQVVVLAVPPWLARGTPSWPSLEPVNGLRQGGWLSWVLRVDPAQPLSIRIDDRIAWEFERAEALANRTTSLELKLSRAGGAGTSTQRFELLGASGAVIESASCAGMQLVVTDGNSIDVPVTCFGDTAVAQRVRLRISWNDESHTLYRTVVFPRPCLRVDTRSGVRRLGADEVLYLSDFNTVRLWHPGGRDAFTDPQRLPYLFEGRRPVMPAQELTEMRGYRLQERVAALGDTLSFGSDLIPHDGGSSRSPLAKQIVACGLFNGECPEQFEDGIEKCLLFEIEAEDIEPRPDWRIELLCRSADVLSCETGQFRDLCQLVARPLGGHTTPDVEDLLAARLIINGCVRGRWEREQAFAGLRGSAAKRWKMALEWELAVLPLSGEESSRLVEALLESPDEFLRPFGVSADNGRPEPLGQPGLVQRELLRRLLEQATFDIDGAERVCDALADCRLQLSPSDPQRLVRSIVESASISPFLPYRLIKTLANDPALTRGVANQWTRNVIVGLCGGKTRVQFEEFVLTDPDPLQPWRSRSPIPLARVDPGFVGATLRELKAALIRGTQLSALHRDNLAALCELTRTDSRLARLAAIHFLE